MADILTIFPKTIAVIHINIEAVKLYLNGFEWVFLLEGRHGSNCNWINTGLFTLLFSSFLDECLDKAGIATLLKWTRHLTSSSDRPKRNFIHIQYHINKIL